jgi:hypothetical protein
MVAGSRERERERERGRERRPMVLITPSRA